MTRGKNEDREFLKRVDAMLAGQELDADEPLGFADLRERSRRELVVRATRHLVGVERDVHGVVDVHVVVDHEVVFGGNRAGRRNEAALHAGLCRHSLRLSDV